MQLVGIQESCDYLDRKTDDYEAAKKSEAKLAAEARKAIDDKESFFVHKVHAFPLATLQPQ